MPGRRTRCRRYVVLSVSCSSGDPCVWAGGASDMNVWFRCVDLGACLRQTRRIDAPSAAHKA
jgi:hypothetical protein